MTEENGEKKKPDAKIRIEVDNKASERLASIIEKERAEKDEPSLEKLKLNLIEAHGRADLWTQATSKEMLKDMFENWVNDNAEKAHGTPSGSPLVPQQFGAKSEDLYTKKYDSWKSMVDDLNAKRHDPDYTHQKEAQSYWDELERMWLTGKRTNPKLDDTFNPNLPENVPTLKDVAGTSARTPLHREEGDIAKILEAWRMQNPRIRRAKEQIERGANPAQKES